MIRRKYIKLYWHYSETSWLEQNDIAEMYTVGSAELSMRVDQFDYIKGKWGRKVYITSNIFAGHKYQTIMTKEEIERGLYESSAPRSFEGFVSTCFPGKWLQCAIKFLQLAWEDISSIVGSLVHFASKTNFFVQLIVVVLWFSFSYIFA